MEADVETVRALVKEVFGQPALENLDDGELELLRVAGYTKKARLQNATRQGLLDARLTPGAIDGLLGEVQR